jgi:tRNA G10  N-methylase Trm11
LSRFALYGRRKSGKDIWANFNQYGLNPTYADLVRHDITKDCYRPGLTFDAVVCDPPYGIRIPSKRDARIVSERTDAVSHLLSELIKFSFRHLRPGGRLVYCMITTDEYTDNEMLVHPGFLIIANGDQLLTGHLRRRLIVMVKRVSVVIRNFQPQQRVAMRVAMRVIIARAGHMCHPLMIL